MRMLQCERRATGAHLRLLSVGRVVGCARALFEMGDDVLKVDPPTVVFTGAAGNTCNTTNKLTNAGTTKMAIKIFVNNAALQVAKPFMIIEPGQTTSMKSRCPWPEGAEPPTNYTVAIHYVDAPADMGTGAAMKTAWNNIKDFKTVRLMVEFKGGEAPKGDANFKEVFEKLQQMGQGVSVPIEMLEAVFAQLIAGNSVTPEEIEKAKIELKGKADDKGHVSFPIIQEVFMDVFGPKLAK